MRDAPRYRRVYANEWHDPALRALSAEARNVRFYVSAGPQTTSCGCFRLSTAVAVEDLDSTAEAFESCLQTVCEAMGWAWDPASRVIWITNWFELNPPANPNVVHAWAKLLRNVPDCDVKAQAVLSINHALKELPSSFRDPWRELSKPFLAGESKAQSRTETIQGSGDSGIQRSGNRGTGAGSERKTNGTGAGRHVPATWIQLAKRALTFAGIDKPIETHVQAFFELGGTCSESDAIAALNLARREAHR